MRGMTISQVATAAGVGVPTIRYYERRLLVQEPRRTPSGYREYPSDTVRLIRFIKRAQDLGFTLDEIEGLIALRAGNGRRRDDVRQLAESRVRDIDRKLEQLQAMRAALVTLLETCACEQTKPTCPILEAFDDLTVAVEPERRVARRRTRA